MLPNFLIIGAQKGGTTWLARRLEEHPDVFLSVEKELHFFNHRFDQGTAWYESQFAERSGQAMAGEATPGYLNHPEAPNRIKAVLGEEVKLIASLRHPVDRAYSAFWHYTTRGNIPAETDFYTFFQESDEFGIRSRGNYFAHLSRYFNCFPRENLLILIYERWKKDNQQALNESLAFLQVDAQQWVSDSINRRANSSQDIKRFHGQATTLRRAIRAKMRLLPRGPREILRRMGSRAFEDVVLKSLPKQDDYAPLAEETRQELLVHYLPDIHQLEALLQRDLSIWYS